MSHLTLSKLLCGCCTKAAGAASATKRYIASCTRPEGRAQELARHLPELRRKRKPRFTRKPRRLVFPERWTIRNHPQAVKHRQATGHWEADLMIFRREHGPANVATAVERVSRSTASPY